MGKKLLHAMTLTTPSPTHPQIQFESLCVNVARFIRSIIFFLFLIHWWTAMSLEELVHFFYTVKPGSN